MRYISLFSGIEAASVAWEGLMDPVAFCEIEPFPCEVLKNRYPDIPNLGDVKKIDWGKVIERYGTIDLIVGGSPCQSFSISGNRESLDGESRLMYEYIRAVREVRPKWFLWENVPGALTAKGEHGEKGGAFGLLLEQMDELGYGLAWRTLDAQFFGVAQRRRRLFLVGRFGNASSAAAVLFNKSSVSGNTKSSKQKRKEIAEQLGRSSDRSYTLKLRHTGSDNPGGGVGALIQDDVSATINCVQDQTLFTLAFDGAQITSHKNRNNPQWNDPVHTLHEDCAKIDVICMATGQANAEILQDGSSVTLTCAHEQPIVINEQLK